MHTSSTFWLDEKCTQWQNYPPKKKNLHQLVQTRVSHQEGPRFDSHVGVAFLSGGFMSSPYLRSFLLGSTTIMYNSPGWMWWICGCSLDRTYLKGPKCIIKKTFCTVLYIFNMLFSGIICSLFLNAQVDQHKSREL